MTNYQTDLRTVALTAYWSWHRRDPDVREQMEALYRTANGYPADTPVLAPVPVLPPPDLSLIDVLTERAYPERPVVMRLSGEAGNKPPPPPPPDKG